MSNNTTNRLDSAVERVLRDASGEEYIHDGIQSFQISEFSLSPEVAEFLNRTRLIAGSNMLRGTQGNEHLIFMGRLTLINICHAGKVAPLAGKLCFI